MEQFNKNRLHQIFETYILEQNEKNLEILYINYRDLIYSIAYSFLRNKEDSEDIVQNIFLKLQKLDKEKLPKQNEFTWLYAVTKNESINLLKKNCKIIDYEDIDIPDNLNITNKVIADDEYNFLIKHLDKLERKIVNLKLLSGLSFKEIGNSLNMPVGTIEWKYYKSINWLRILISNDIFRSA